MDSKPLVFCQLTDASSSATDVRHRNSDFEFVGPGGLARRVASEQKDQGQGRRGQCKATSLSKKKLASKSCRSTPKRKVGCGDQMKKRGRLCEGCSLEWPHFFKIILATSREKLMIPPAFAHHVRRELSNALLDSRAVKDWHVKLSSDVDGLVFQNGWKEFFEYHSLRIGDLLLFRYDKNMHFSVRVFGNSCCEDGYVFSDKNDEGRIHLQRPTRIPILRPRYHSGGCGFDDGENKFVEKLKTFCRIQKMHDDLQCVKKKRVDASVEYDDSSRDPVFEVVLKHYNGRTGVQQNLYIPCDFARQCFGNEIKDFPSGSLYKASRVLFNLTDRSVAPCTVWVIAQAYKGNLRMCRISAGWSEFCKRNRLRAGDRCIFKINEDGLGFNVYIHPQRSE